MYLSMEFEADSWLDKAEETSIFNEIKLAYFEKSEDIIEPCEQLNNVDQKKRKFHLAKLLYKCSAY